MRLVQADGDAESSDVSIVDLFAVLVDDHGLGVRQAVRHLTLGMLAAGYPADSETVSATDARDIVEVPWGVGRRSDG